MKHLHPMVTTVLGGECNLFPGIVVKLGVS